MIGETVGEFVAWGVLSGLALGTFTHFSGVIFNLRIWEQFFGE